MAESADLAILTVLGGTGADTDVPTFCSGRGFTRTSLDLV